MAQEGASDLPTGGERPPAHALAADRELKVFISYSRRDASDFADELVAGLELAGLAPYLDRHDIAAGEDWETRLGSLILEADTVVFVVSPEAVKSRRCKWEVDHTAKLGKRLLPVIWKPVPEEAIPDKLRRLQFVRFDAGRGIARPLAQLAEALRRDLDWIREHTRQGELAARWEARGRPESLLLRGDTLDTCKVWVERRRAGAPEITDLQRAFFNASEDAEKSRATRERRQLEAMRTALEEKAAAQNVAEQATAAKLQASRQVVQRTVSGIVAALLLAILASALAYYSWGQKQLAEKWAAENEKLAADGARANARADRLANLVSSNPAGERVMKKSCRDAICVTWTLATTRDKAQHARFEDQFWELYFGSMIIVESHQRKTSGRDSSTIESAMVSYGNGLMKSKTGEPPHSSLFPLAKVVRDECVSYLNLELNADPCA